MLKLPFPLPQATYRVQLHSGFTFEHLAQIVPYLDSLGISDIYAAPIFRAAPGSTHGYDVCDQNEVNPELGGMDGLLKVSELLRERGMGFLVDFVPNHMGTHVPHNWRWMDVLEHGHLSRFASFFDIEWKPRQASLQYRILVPVLGDFYGRILEAGGISLLYEKSTFRVAYESLRFPLSPESTGGILRRLAWAKDPASEPSKKLALLGEKFQDLPKPSPMESPEQAEQRNRESHALHNELARLIETEKLGDVVAGVLATLNGKPGEPATFDALHDILEEQHYRLAFWKAGTQEINYRRFFAVDSLVGVHMEQPAVFEESHRLLQKLIEKNIVTGVRVDHIDGLWNPAEYMQRLSELGRAGKDPVYLLVEKILTEGEKMPTEWAVHGTSGYDFTGELINLLIESRHEAAFTRVYRDFTGMLLDPYDQAYQLKLYIMEAVLPNVIDSLAQELETNVKSDRRWRDWTLHDLSLAISRIIACLAVYRTYHIVGGKPDAVDSAVVGKAVAEAMRRNPGLDPRAFLFILDLWTGRYPDARSTPELKTVTDLWICKLQQFTGAIMAKSVEDTLFYRNVRLFAANEVGHHPGEFGRPLATFHQANLQRLQDWPGAMLGTSTHDTKMSEDVRARLLALSALPDRWQGHLATWSAANHAFKTKIGDAFAPDANEEYLLYQALLGAWPLAPAKVDAEFYDRMKNYLRKSLSEAKMNTNWVMPNEPWMNACDTFVAALLDRGKAAAFWKDFVPFADELAWRGMNLSLVQVAIKLTVPGVPDIYQGNELWDFSLVDPDNRRPVDYLKRQESLESLKSRAPQALQASWQDGRIKLHLTRTLLTHRRQNPELYAQGSYTPVEIKGPNADAFVAYLRQHGEQRLLVVAIRHLGEGTLSSGLKLGKNATLLLPPEVASGWHDLLTPHSVQESLTQLPLASLLGDLPVGVFSSPL